jgi:hypothetical protein
MEAPPMMLESIQQKAKQYLESNQSDITFREPINLGDWKYDGIKLTQMVKEKVVQNIENLFRNIEDLPNFNLIIEKVGDKETVLAQALRRTEYITVTFTRKCARVEAHWQPWLYQLRVCMPYPTTHKDIAWMISHELIHFAQSFISMAIYGKESDMGVGLPSTKIKTPQFIQENDSDKKDTTRYYMDDMEFYTQLNDIIGNIQLQMKQNPDDMDDYSKRRLFKRTLMFNTFLKTLKNHPQGQGKYQKAVSEIYKIIFNERQHELV